MIDAMVGRNIGLPMDKIEVFRRRTILDTHEAIYAA